MEKIEILLEFCCYSLLFNVIKQYYFDVFHGYNVLKRLSLSNFV